MTMVAIAAKATVHRATRREGRNLAASVPWRIPEIEGITTRNACTISGSITL
jgi:hypothetical protein